MKIWKDIIEPTSTEYLWYRLNEFGGFVGWFKYSDGIWKLVKEEDVNPSGSGGNDPNAQKVYEGGRSSVTDPKEGDVCLESYVEEVSVKPNTSSTYNSLDLSSYSDYKIKITAFNGAMYSGTIEVTHADGTTETIDSTTDLPITYDAGEITSLLSNVYGLLPYGVNVYKLVDRTDLYEYHNGTWELRVNSQDIQKVYDVAPAEVTRPREGDITEVSATLVKENLQELGSYVATGVAYTDTNVIIRISYYIIDGAVYQNTLGDVVTLTGLATFSGMMTLGSAVLCTIESSSSGIVIKDASGVTIPYNNTLDLDASSIPLTMMTSGVGSADRLSIVETIPDGKVSLLPYLKIDCYYGAYKREYINNVWVERGVPVITTSQNLSDAQKKQARKNIDTFESEDGQCYYRNTTGSLGNSQVTNPKEGDIEYYEDIICSANLHTNVGALSNSGLTIPSTSNHIRITANGTMNYGMGIRTFYVWAKQPNDENFTKLATCNLSNNGTNGFVINQVSASIEGGDTISDRSVYIPFTAIGTIDVGGITIKLEEDTSGTASGGYISGTSPWTFCTIDAVNKLNVSLEYNNGAWRERGAATDYEAVHFTTQNLTNKQKIQARTNLDLYHDVMNRYKTESTGTPLVSKTFSAGGMQQGYFLFNEYKNGVLSTDLPTKAQLLATGTIGTAGTPITSDMITDATAKTFKISTYFLVTEGNDTIYVGDFGNEPLNLVEPGVYIMGYSFSGWTYSATGVYWETEGEPVKVPTRFLPETPGSVEITALPEASMTVQSELDVIGLTISNIEKIAKGNSTALVYKHGSGGADYYDRLNILFATYYTLQVYGIVFSDKTNKYDVSSSPFGLTVTVTAL